MKSTVKQRAKVGKKFYFSMIKLFMFCNVIGIIILSIIYYQLQKYEESTPSGAIRSYLKLIQNGDYDEIYDESKLVFAQFNTKDEYSNYLKSIYENKPLAEATFARQSYSNEEFSYYNINIGNETISTVQLKKDKSIHHVRTLTSVWNFNFDVAGDIQFYINNELVDSGYILEKSTDSNAYANYPDKKTAIPITRYHLDNFVNIPIIEIKNENYIAVKDNIQDQFYIGKKPVGDTLKEYEELIQNTSETYSKYITEDVSFASLRKLLNRKTTFYEEISQFNNGWYSIHDDVEFANIDIYDIVELSENAFIGTIKYDYNVITDDKITTYPTTNQLFFIKENEKWLCTNIQSER